MIITSEIQTTLTVLSVIALPLVLVGIIIMIDQTFSAATGSYYQVIWYARGRRKASGCYGYEHSGGTTSSCFLIAWWKAQSYKSIRGVECVEIVRHSMKYGAKLVSYWTPVRD